VAGSITQLVFDGVADGPVGVGLDILAAAARVARAGLIPLNVGRMPGRTRLVSLDGSPVRTAARRSLTVDGALNLRGLGAGDVLVLPGLGMFSEAALDRGLARADIIRGFTVIRRALAKGMLLAASCSATFVLAGAGVLDGHAATTTWWLAPSFARRFPRVTLRGDRMVVRSGRIFTAGTSFAHADLMLAIVAHTTSAALAHMVAKYLLLDERSSQARYMVPEHLRSADPVVQALEHFIAQNIQRQLSLAEMARATATSPRTLARRLEHALGSTPLHFAQRVRVSHALRLLETTTHSVEQVAAAVGYADAAAFRRVFRRELGESPRAASRRNPRAPRRAR
jgi:transcriptional regulator GlxA family with amidase domain